MNNSEEKALYPIRELSSLTGVNPVTLRAWERRYGIIKPERTPKGHRYYTDEHVQLVLQILYWLEQGYPIREVKLLMKEGTTKAEESSKTNDDWQEQQQQLIRAAEGLKSQYIDELWNAGFASYPFAVYYERCIVPVLNFLRSNSTRHVVINALENMLKRKLGALLLLQQRHNKGDLLLLVTNHEQAEIDTLACAGALGAAVFRVEYFGAMTTPADLELALSIVPAANVWINFHPLTSEGQQLQWQEYLAESTLTHYLTGTVPSFDNNQENLHLLEGNLSNQVRTFITGDAL